MKLLNVPRTSSGFLPLLCALYLLLYLDRVNIATAAPLIQNELHLSNAALGIVLSAFAYSYAFCQLIGGLAGERLGPRRTLCASVILVCIATAATGLSSGIAALIAARIALGFSEGAALPTATQAMAKQLPQGRWGFAQGITHAFARLGNFVTPPIVAALILFSSWRVAFLILAATGLVWIAAWLFWYREPEAPEAVFLPPPCGEVENVKRFRVGVVNEQSPHPHFAKGKMRASPLYGPGTWVTPVRGHR